MKVFWVLLLSFIVKCCSLSDAASDCGNMRLALQEGAFIEIKASTASDTGGEVIKVEIHADDETNFKSFYLQVQSKDGTPLSGEFKDDENLHTFTDCGTYTYVVGNSDLSNHMNQEISLKWKARDYFEGEVDFR